MSAPAETPDAVLLPAWADYSGALLLLHESGADALEETDAPAWKQLEKADDLICYTPATTLGGAAVKLRRSLQILETDKFMDRALRERDDAAIFARAERLDYEARLIADALKAIVEAEARR